MKLVATSLMSLLLTGSLQAQETQLDKTLSQNLERASERDAAFGNSRVDLAPKAWPYPMVVSPGRPVLPGTAW